MQIMFRQIITVLKTEIVREQHNVCMWSLRTYSSCEFRGRNSCHGFMVSYDFPSVEHWPVDKL